MAGISVTLEGNNIQLAFEKGDHTKALRYFTDGTEKIAAVTKLKDVTLGRGKTLLATGNLDEAKKVFEQVAAVREWRGEATAFSVYSLGEIEARQGPSPLREKLRAMGRMA